MTDQPLTPRQCAAWLAVLTALATVTAALLWGTGCATTPGDCMVEATCAQARLLREGLDARVGIVLVDKQGQHAVCVWRVPRNSCLWVYDGEGAFETPATTWTETNEIARAMTCRYFLIVQWDRWVTCTNIEVIRITTTNNVGLPGTANHKLEINGSPWKEDGHRSEIHWNPALQEGWSTQ